VKLGERLRAARQLRRLTQAEVARRARTSQTTVSFVERGAEVQPNVVRRIARVLDLPVDEPREIKI
jgi:transcriptional regulator with XRE-family HTH domain